MDRRFFIPLFSVSVEHAYFADSRWGGLVFEPDAETLRMARLPSFVLRQTDDGVMAGVDGDHPEALRTWAAGRKDGRLCFRFKVHVRDRGFANYTHYPQHGKNAIPCFDNLDDVEQAGQPAVLNRDAWVSEADFTEIDALVAEGVLDASEKRMPPDFIVTLFIDPGVEKGLMLRKYRLVFGTRQSYWKYYLLGDMNREQSFIVDLEKRVEFLACDEAMVAGNRPARVFRSNLPIPLLEKPEYRFQLKERSAVGERVLVKRLPLASGARLGREVIDGRNELVLENFVQY